MTDKPGEPRDLTDSSHLLYDPAEDPTHPFYEADKTEAQEPPDEDAYKVGPGRPPKQHTWKKGGRSPNPKGRPKKIPSMKPDLKKALESALNDKVVFTKDKKEIVLTKAAFGIQQLVNQFAKGDRHARRDLFQYATLLGVDLQAKEVISEALGVTHQAIVDAAFLRRQQQSSPEPAPDDHVKAPPDLVDDDVTKPEPNARPAASPQQDRPAKKPVEPERDQHGRPKPAMSVSDINYIRAARERNLAQQKKNQGGS
jgi:Family of unknown function (DUF5681)